MNHSLLNSFQKAICLVPLFAFSLFSSFVLAQKNAPVAGDAALLTDLLKKDYNTLDPEVRREQLAKDRTIVIGTLKRYLTENQQESLIEIQKVNFDKQEKDYLAKQKANTSANKQKDKNKIIVKPDAESLFLEYKKMEQKLALYSTKYNKTSIEIAEMNHLVTSSNSFKKDYYRKLHSLDSSTFTALIDVFKTENQYLCYVSDEFHAKYEALNNFQDDQYAEASQESSVQKALPFIGGDLAFEVIIDGLSKFLAERIKEELTVAVIERVQDYLRNPSENDPLAELKVLLPRTQAYLLSFKASQMANFPDEIKQYIEDDLKHLPDNLGDLGQTPRIQRLVKEYPELDFAIEALEFIPNLSKIKNPVDFFDLLENSRNLSRWTQDSSKTVQFNLANTLKLSGLLAHSLTVVDNGELRMAGADFLNAYGSEVPFYMMYLGFLHQQNIKYYSIRFRTDDNLPVIKKIGTAEQSMNMHVIPFSYLTNDLVNVVHRDTKEELTATLISNEITKKLKETQETFSYFKNMFVTIGANSEKLYASAQLIRKAHKNGTETGPDTLYAFIDDMVNLAEEVTFSADSLCTYLLNKKSAVIGKVFLYIDNSKVPVQYAFSWKDDKASYVTPLNLRDKVLPYLAVARKTNELVYDLQQKKYATAIIKALELTTDIKGTSLTPELEYLKSVLSIFPEADGLKLFRFKDTLNDLWHAKSWSNIMAEINKATKSVKIKNHKNEADIILIELKKVKTYIKNNRLTCSIEFLDSFNLLIDEIDNIAHELEISSDIDQVKGFLKSQEFKKLVLSYYTGTYLNDRINQIKTEVRNSGFFTPNDVDHISKCIDDYIINVFEYFLKRDRASFNIATKSFAKEMRKFLNRIPESDKFHLSEQTIKIIHFVNDMAKAENSDDVKDAIQAFALPAGSYSLKRQQKFTFSVNSYPGVLASIESTWTNNKPYNTFSPSFTAPVGLNLCWSAPRGMSHSIFVPVIDVGAFTRMYIGGKSLDTTSSTDSVYFTTLPEFSFMNLFSPGVYYALGFRKTPLSLYAGAQWGPSLREVKKEEGEIKTVNNYNSFRFSIGLVLDIPLWNIHSKSRL